MNRAMSSLRRLKPYSVSKIKHLQSKGRFKTKEIRITQIFRYWVQLFVRL